MTSFAFQGSQVKANHWLPFATAKLHMMKRSGRTSHNIDFLSTEGSSIFGQYHRTLRDKLEGLLLPQNPPIVYDDLLISAYSSWV